MSEECIKKILLAVEQLKANIALGKYPDAVNSAKEVLRHTVYLENINSHTP